MVLVLVNNNNPGELTCTEVCVCVFISNFSNCTVFFHLQYIVQILGTILFKYFYQNPVHKNLTF